MSVIDTLQSIKNETVAIITTKTVMKLLKKDKEGNKNELGTIYRIAKSNVTFGKAYTEAVNEQRIAEKKADDFVAEERKWGERDGIFLTKGDAQYVTAILNSSLGSSYVKEDGTPIEHDAFKQFISTAASSSNNQGLEQAVLVRTYKLESITDVVIL